MCVLQADKHMPGLESGDFVVAKVVVATGLNLVL